MQKTFDSHDVIQQVLHFAETMNIFFDTDTLKLDGEIHRVRTREDKSGDKSGAYCIFMDSWPAGFVQDWRKGIKENWKYDISGLDDEQRKYFNSDEFRKKCELEERKKREERKRKHDECSERARILYNALEPAPDNHPYLVRKNVRAYSIGIYQVTGNLAIPLRDIHGKFKSIQWIPAAPNQNKTFFPGAGLEGAFFSIDLFTIDKNYDGFILLGEGYATMAKVYELTGYPCVAAMSCHRLDEISHILRAEFPNSKIIITADNDRATEIKTGRNPGILYSKILFDAHIIQNFTFPTFDSPEDGSDWDDYALLNGNEKAARIILNDLYEAAIPKSVKDMQSHGKLEVINAQNLRSMVFPPIKWAVPGFIPSGLSILGGAPKTGKSIMALHIALGIAIGGCVFGCVAVEKGDVLYLALEDTQRRLQERVDLSNVLSEKDDISGLEFVTRIEKQHKGGMEYLDWWLSVHHKARLIVIDTLQRFRKELSGKGNVYAEDYEVTNEIKALADKYDVAILVLHHLKKMSAKEELQGDWIYSFSGSAGISGSADALFMLKRERSGTSAKLYRTGRDVEEKEFWFSLDNFGWVYKGEAEELTMPTWKAQILDFLKIHHTITVDELGNAAGLMKNTARQHLARLAKEGVIVRREHGIYSLAENYNNA